MSVFYKTINSIIDRSDFINQYDSIIASQKSGNLFYNLNRSAKSMLLARAFEKTGKSIIFVTADDKVAEDYLDDFDLFVGKESAHFLPDYEVLPYEQRSPHYMIRAQRIETLTAAVSGNLVFTVFLSVLFSGKLLHQKSSEKIS